MCVLYYNVLSRLGWVSLWHICSLGGRGFCYELLNWLYFYHCYVVLSVPDLLLNVFENFKQQILLKLVTIGNESLLDKRRGDEKFYGVKT